MFLVYLHLGVHTLLLLTVAHCGRDSWGRDGKGIGRCSLENFDVIPAPNLRILVLKNTYKVS